MIILTLVDGHEEIFVTFHQLKSCRSTTRYHSVLDIKKERERQRHICTHTQIYTYMNTHMYTDTHTAVYHHTKTPLGNNTIGLYVYLRLNSFYLYTNNHAVWSSGQPCVYSSMCARCLCVRLYRRCWCDRPSDPISHPRDVLAYRKSANLETSLIYQRPDSSLYLDYMFYLRLGCGS